MFHKHLRAFGYAISFTTTFSVGLSACGDGKTSALSGADQPKLEESAHDLIYGLDNRQDLYQLTSEMHKRLAKSTVALVERDSMKSVSSGFKLATSSYASEYNLCSSEPFYSQPVGAFCSGSLVGPRQILTAGHCVTNASSCASTQFVFGFDMSSSTTVNTTFGVNQVYNCARIVHRVQEATGQDFAVIELDRDVVGYDPLAVNRIGTITTAAPVFVIGHPSGLPTKVAGGANVRRVESSYFVANLDTYGGNSGSAVFNATTGLIEGILVRGDNDYVQQGSCSVSNKCSDTGCRGEDVTLIKMATAYIPDTGSSNPPSPPSSPTSPATPTSPTNGATVRVENVANTAIPDNSVTGIVSTVNVAEAPAGRKLQIDIDITHTWVGDLELTLTSPDGKSILLANKQGGRQHDLRGTFGVDLSPCGNLTELQTTTTAGTWTLRVRDLARYDVGVLNSWALNFVR